MDIADLLMPGTWRLAGYALAVPLLLVALRRARLARLFDSEQSHLFLGIVFFLTVLWNLRGQVGSSIAFHLLGTAALTLAVRAPLALVGGAIVVALVTVVRGALWANAAWVWLSLVALPAAVVSALLAVVERWLPPNFFIYVFAVAFGGGALALAGGGLAGAVLAVHAAGQPADLVYGEFLPFLIYLAFAEGTLTGMLLTLAVVYRPAWVATFDDRRYLRDR